MLLQQHEQHKLPIIQVIQLSIMQQVMHLLQFNHHNQLIMLRSQPPLKLNQLQYSISLITLQHVNINFLQVLIHIQLPPLPPLSQIQQELILLPSEPNIPHKYQQPNNAIPQQHLIILLFIMQLLRQIKEPQRHHHYQLQLNLTRFQLFNQHFKLKLLTVKLFPQSQLPLNIMYPMYHLGIPLRFMAHPHVLPKQVLLRAIEHFIWPTKQLSLHYWLQLQLIQPLI